MEKCKKTILIPIETLSRELDYKIYLSMCLVSKGCDVILGRKQSLNRLFDRFSHFTYIDKGYHEGQSEKIYDKIKSKNGIILNLDEEGAVDFPDNSTLNNRYSKVMLNSVDKTFFWGKNQKEIFKNRVESQSKLIVTGHPRFQLLKDDFFGLYDDNAKKIKNKFQDFILVNTNFGFGNNIKGDNFVISNYGNRFKNIQNIIDEDKLKFKAIITLVNELSLQYKIVLRPHPEELIEAYSEFFKNNSNVFIIRENSSIPWIKASKACIHIDCTTGIEAAILNKRTISYIPEYLEMKMLTQLPIEVSEIFSTTSEIISSLNKGNKKNTNKKKILNDYFSIYLNIDNLIEQIILASNKNENFSYKTKKKVNDYIYNMKSFIKFYLPNKNPIEKSKLKNYNKKTFKSRFDFFKSNLNFLSRVKMKKTGDLFYIYTL